ncbi:pentapeptide repeat-containing protein [Nocardia sp. NPDC051570]|uniref:pentapeptide repeat-containing protein n=1 Tax=Nocardia sp. NPDC051570 TaxID=3364324 RepID=UPI0037B336F4
MLSPKSWPAAGMVLVAFAAVVWLTYQVPLWLVRDTKGADSFRGAFVQLIGYGIALAVALYGIKKYSLDKEKQYTDSFSAAIGQLVSESSTVRAGGILGLERIMSFSPSDHIRVIEIWADFLREHTATPGISIDPDQPPADDIAAVLAAFQRRKAISGEPPLRLAHIRIPHARWDRVVLSRADVTGADFGHARLRGAVLTETVAVDAEFVRADLTGADLRGATLNGARFIAAHLKAADLRGADLSDAVLIDADLRGADLREAVGLTTEQLTKARTDQTTRLR